MKLIWIDHDSDKHKRFPQMAVNMSFSKLCKLALSFMCRLDRSLLRRGMGEWLGLGWWLCCRIGEDVPLFGRAKLGNGRK
jgi:hypothetical protein